MPRTGPLDRALSDLAGLRESLRGAGNRERAGRFDCTGCVAWCCRHGHNSMRATPLEAEAIARHLEAEGRLAEGLRRAAAAAARWRLDGGEEPARTYDCPFLDPSNRCGVHPVKPLGCLTFTPVRDGGCDQDGERLLAALERAAGLNDAAHGEDGWTDLPFPLALLAVRPPES